MPIKLTEWNERRGSAKAAACERYLRRVVRPGLKLTEPHRNVVGIGIGPKMRGGRQVAAESVRFYVERKFARDSDVPPDHLLPKTIGQLPTDVVEIGQMRSSGAAVTSTGTSTASPCPPEPHVIQPGTSCGVRFGRVGDGATGTVGAIVSRGEQRFLLGSAHVLARINGFLLGTPILCPGPIDLPALAGDAGSHGGAHGHTEHTANGGGGGTECPMPKEEDFQRARLSDFSILSLSGPNQMDAAIAEIVSSNFDPQILGIGRLTSPIPMQAMQGMHVLKSGVATGVSRGQVIDTDFDGRLSFRQGPVTLENQILIESDEKSPFAWEGDSGALAVTRFSWDNGDSMTLAVALVVGFSLPESNTGGGRSYCVATPIGPVLTRFSVSLVTG